MTLPSHNHYLNLNTLPEKVDPNEEVVVAITLLMVLVTTTVVPIEILEANSIITIRIITRTVVSVEVIAAAIIILVVVEAFRLVEVAVEDTIIRKGIEVIAEVEETIGVEVVVEITIIEEAAEAGTIAESIMTISLTSILATTGADSPTTSIEEEVEEITWVLLVLTQKETHTIISNFKTTIRVKMGNVDKNTEILKNDVLFGDFCIFRTN